MLPVKYLEDLKWVPMDVADVVGTFIEVGCMSGGSTR